MAAWKILISNCTKFYISRKIFNLPKVAFESALFYVCPAVAQWPSDIKQDNQFEQEKKSSPPLDAGQIRSWTLGQSWGYFLHFALLCVYGIRAPYNRASLFMEATLLP